MAAHVTTVSLITLALDSQAGPEKLCEPAVDECLCQPCVNGATCEDLVGHFACHCPAGYDGQLCQNDIDECQPNPCASGSTCLNRLGSFTCLCPPGIVGRTCDLPVGPDFSLEFTSAGKLDYAVWDEGLRIDWKRLEQLTLCSCISTLDKQYRLGKDTGARRASSPEQLFGWRIRGYYHSASSVRCYSNSASPGVTIRYCATGDDFQRYNFKSEYLSNEDGHCAK